MKILAFDTSTTACSVALQSGDEIKVLHEVAPMQQARRILIIIQKLLADSSLTLADLDAIAFGCGPGSFTGIRIASSVAQGIGFAKDLPIIRISSLAAFAQAAFEAGKGAKYLIAVDAHMQQIYWAIYAANQHGFVELTNQELVCSPEDIIPPENTHDWYAVGDGWEKYREKLLARLGFEPTIISSSPLPIAKAILRLASESYTKGDNVTASDAIPVYLR